METEENKVPSQENPIESSIRQEMELYSQLYPDPKSPVEVIANYQHVINNLTFKMNAYIETLNLKK